MALEPPSVGAVNTLWSPPRSLFQTPATKESGSASCVSKRLPNARAHSAVRSNLAATPPQNTGFPPSHGKREAAEPRMIRVRDGVGALLREAPNEAAGTYGHVQDAVGLWSLELLCALLHDRPLCDRSHHLSPTRKSTPDEHSGSPVYNRHGSHVAIESGGWSPTVGERAAHKQGARFTSLATHGLSHPAGSPQRIQPPATTGSEV